jgi:hypothetical protein
MRTAKYLLACFAIVLCTKDAAAQNRPMALNGIATAKNSTDNNTGRNSFRQLKVERFLTISIPEGGANGASVIYHPKEKLYYAAQAGNKEFPLIIFKSDGSIVSEEGQATLIDIRGLWYNPKTQEIGGNGYQEFGWFTYSLNRNGIVESIKIIREGRNQPDDHSPGVLNTKDDEVLFLSGLNIVCYSTNGNKKNKTIQLHIGARNAEENDASDSYFEEHYNTRSIIYTGKEGAEIGLLHVTRKQVELYNIKTGYMTGLVDLPLSFQPETFFNFSYANGVYWIFNKETRKWHGFKEAE